MTGVEVVTFGCRLNAAESETIRRAAAAAGLAGAVILNTCAVTAEAERQARQAIRRARREHPGARIIVTGCAASLAPERYAAMPEVDQVLDNRAKLRVESYRGLAPQHPDPAPRALVPPLPAPLLLPRAAAESFAQAVRHSAARPPAANPEDRNTGAPADGSRVRRGAAPRDDGLSGTARESAFRARAYLPVQQGCDHRCTFCIIPYARGPSRSLPPGDIISAARRLLAEGVREIVLTGVDLTAYGADLPGAPPLGRVVRQLLAAVPELRRLRLSSLDPAEIDDALWRAVAEEPRLMPHLHLSLQAGDDLILKRMKRRHRRAQAIAAARRARDLRPGIALGADLIAGFPTESEDMFRRSLELIGECGLAFVHVFPYSPRPGTPAARMPAVPPALVRERAARLREAAAAALAGDLAGRVGRRGEVLVEAPGRGRAECYAAVAFAGPAEPGSLLPMRFAGHDGSSLSGVPV